MTARALHGAGIDASFAVGARVFGVPGAVAGGYAGTSDVGVVEADESDGSFLRYHPRVGIITSIEPDHLDLYGTVEALHDAFADFARSCEVLGRARCRPRGARIAADAAASGVRVVTYGAGEDLDVAVTCRRRGCRRRHVPADSADAGRTQSSQRRGRVGRGRRDGR